jgi:SH3-like domain-containing protein
MTKKNTTPIVLLLSTALLIPLPARALCVNVPEANLRQGPGTHYEKTWEVFTYMPFKKIGHKGSWHRVSDVDGDVHWIHNSLVTNSVRCAVVKKAKANVRSGPGTQHPLAELGTIEKYYSFEVIGEKGRWLKVRDDISNSGWVAKSLLWVQ